MRGAIFLDRDGTLIEDTGYAYELKDMQIYPYTVDALRMLGAVYPLFIITNQPGIEMGLYSEAQFWEFNNHMLREIEKHGVEIIETRFCPHKGGCDCRKPSTKYIEEISKKYNLEPKQSWVVGDHPSDIQMGLKAGCHTAYLLTGHGRKHLSELEHGGLNPDLVTSNLLDAARSILQLEDQSS